LQARYIKNGDRVIMKYYMFLLAILSAPSLAGNWAAPAVPTRIDIERGNGFFDLRSIW